MRGQTGEGRPSMRVLKPCPVHSEDPEDSAVPQLAQKILDKVPEVDNFIRDTDGQCPLHPFISQGREKSLSLPNRFHLVLHFVSTSRTRQYTEYLRLSERSRHIRHVSTPLPSCASCSICCTETFRYGTIRFGDQKHRHSPSSCRNPRQG
jgi:hypothetical protein